MSLLKLGSLGAGALLLLVLASPGIYYLIALGKIDGRPLPPPRLLEPTAVARAWQHCRGEGEPRLLPLNPWALTIEKLFGEPRAPNPSECLAYRVASKFNESHLHSKSWWHASSAALTIWLTRHWSAEQLASWASESDA